MIRILMQDDDDDQRYTVVLGLEPANIDRMERGDPIRVNLRNLDPDGPPTSLPDIDVVISAIDTDDWRRFMQQAPFNHG